MERKYISEIRVELSLPKDSYLKNIPALRYLENGNVLKFDKDITFLVGENGVGKSTIIEAIAVASRINPEGGNENHMFASCNTHSELNEYLDISLKGYPKKKYFLRAETFYNLATYLRNVNFDYSDNLIDYHKMSHGQSFLAAVQNLNGNGLYIFDEPEAALSPLKLMTLMCEINRLANHNSQFIIATHSPILMTMPNSDVLSLSDNGIEKIDYTETEHYKISKMFLDYPERMIKYLFENE